MSPASDRIDSLQKRDRIAHDLGIGVLAADESKVTVQMVVSESHIGWHGRCHGGVVFTLADVAMSYLSNCGDNLAYAVHASVDFIAGLSVGQVATATATSTHTNGRVAIHDVVVTADGETVAVFRGNTRSTSEKHQWEPREIS